MSVPALRFPERTSTAVEQVRYVRHPGAPEFYTKYIPSMGGPEVWQYLGFVCLLLACLLVVGWKYSWTVKDLQLVTPYASPTEEVRKALHANTH